MRNFLARGAACVVLALGACAGTGHQLPQVSDADIKQLQQEIASQEATPLLTYPRSHRNYRAMLARINNRLLKNAQPLCEHAGYPKCFFQTVYRPGDDLNAFASDGYQITLYRGLMDYLESEDEIAAVVAHEMGHHLARHNEEGADNMAAGAVATAVLGAVLVGAANANNATSYSATDTRFVEDMAEIGAEFGHVSYSKEQEREADLLGAYLLDRAGYSLSKAERLYYVLTKLPGEEGARAGLFDTHPTGPERIVAWRKIRAEVAANKAKLPYRIEAQQK